MCKRARGLLTALYCLGALNAAAQTQDFSYLKPPKLTPASPQVTALFRLNEVPVTLYSGLPDISVPITEIKLKNFSLPVSLQYQSGSIRVDEVATDVGLGWSLLAGGSLTHLQRGASDLTGGYTAYQTINPAIVGPAPQFAPDNISDPRYQWYVDAGQREFDTEPDLFSYSVGGFSGKFFYGQDGFVHNIPLRPVKVTGMFNLKNENGINYFFNTQESNVSEVGSGSVTWHISEITTPLQETILFTYEDVNYSYRNYFGESRYKYLAGANDLQLIGSAGVIQDNLPFGNTTVYGKRLKEISASNGAVVKFFYAPAQRYDLPGTNALTTIELYYQTRLIKRFRLIQEYIGNTANSLSNRLRLKEVYEEDPAGQTEPPYRFFYNDAIPLPDRLSNGQDHWGFYNGIDGSTRLPAKPEHWPSGADRSPNAAFSQAGILNKVQYPTGGSVLFTFEQNDIWVENEQHVAVVQDGAGVGGVPYTTQERIFEIPAGAQNVKVYYNTYNDPYTPGGPIGEPPIENDPNCFITLTRPNGSSELIFGRNSSPTGDPFSWTPGTYKVVIETTGENYYGFWQVQFTHSQITYYTGPREVGGVRLKEAVYTDPLVPANNKVTKYLYAAENAQPLKSSGTVPSLLPLYEYQRQLARYNSSGDLIETRILVQTSNAILPLSFAQGNVLYTRVTVLDGPNGENGKKTQTFTSFNITGGDFGFPSTPRGTFDWANGKPVKAEAFRKNGSDFELIRREENSYDFAPDAEYWAYFYQPAEPWEAYKGIGLQVNTIVPEYANGVNVRPAKFEVGYYQYISKWHRLDSTAVTERDPASGLALRTTTRYDYSPASLQTAQVRSTNSKQEESRVQSKYAYDLPAGTVRDKLLNRNMLTTLVEQRKYKGSSQLLQQALINYAPWQSDKFLLPLTVQNAYRGTTLETEITYTAYDEYGNIAEFVSRDGIVHTLLWGYGGQYLVMEAAGLTYQQVQNVVNMNIVNMPSSDQQLRDHLDGVRQSYVSDGKVKILTYTYLPLSGLTSQTDATGKTIYFDYDSFNRLKLIRDSQNNVLKLNDYKYQVIP